MKTAIRPIRTDGEHEAALGRIDELMGAVPGSDDADELDALVRLVEAHEDERFPIDLPDPVTAIEFRMEQEDLTRGDLVSLLGSRAMVSEVLSGKRELTPETIRTLHVRLGIPVRILIGSREAGLPGKPDNAE